MADLSVPASPADVTAEWLTESLRSSGSLDGVSIASIASEQIAVGEGFAGQLARISISYEGDSGDAPSSLIGKFASPHADTRELLAVSGGYEREVRFYSDLAADSGLPTPRCYPAAYDPDSGTFVILLEDLSPAETGDQILGATIEEARFVVAELARFHARWWNDESLVTLEWMRPPAGLGERVITIFDEGLPAFREKRAAEFPRMDALVTRAAKVLPTLVGELEGRFGKRPYTLVHGDLRLDNLFLPVRDGDRFTVIDWQGATLGPGAADLSYWLALSLTVEVRRAHEDELLKLYHSTLVEHGVDDYKFSQLKRDYAGSLVTLIPFAVVASAALDLTSERGEALANALFGRMDEALAEHKAGRLLRIAPWAIRGARVWNALRSPFSRRSRA
jgi:hypothetical protein